MKMKPLRKNLRLFLWACFFLAASLSGCTTGVTPSASPTLSATRLLIVSSTTGPTSPSPRSTPYPTYTPYLTYTAFPTYTPYPSAKPTPSHTILGFPSELHVKVAKVIDGDTILVEASDGNKDLIRLLGVDTPEIDRRNKPNEYGDITNTTCLNEWGRRAQAFAVDKLEGQMVTVILDGATFGELFSFGRLLAFVELEGQDFSAMLVKLGYARVYTEEYSSRQGEYRDLQLQAQAGNTGLWGCRGVPSTPGATATPARLPAARATATPTVTGTPTAEPTVSPPPTVVLSPTATLTPTPIPAPTPTIAPAPTATSGLPPTTTPTPQPTATPAPIATPEPPPTSTPAPTQVSTPVPTATPVPTPAPLPTATLAPDPTPEPLPSSGGCEIGQVDINSASAEELELIIHIGPVRATEAVQLRPFSSLDDLVRINGIGQSRLADIKSENLACVGD